MPLSDIKFYELLKKSKHRHRKYIEKPKRKYTNRAEAQRLFEEKRDRIKKIAQQFENTINRI